MKSFITWISTLILLFITTTGYTQCVDEVDFFTWKKEGNPHSLWVTENDSTVRMTGETQPPAFFVSPQDFLNVRITGKMKVDGGTDDDFIGFVFGYKSPDNSTPDDDYEFLLFDWKANRGEFQNYIAYEGMSLIKVNKTIPEAAQWEYWWAHKNENGFQILDKNLGNNKGWNKYQTYEFELMYTSTRTVIIIDTDTIFDLAGCFEPGRFGFYSFSQENALYWGLDYTLRFDFKAEPDRICPEETVHFQTIDTECSIIPSNIVTWDWDFGDGNTSGDINPDHAYDTSGIYHVKLRVEDQVGCKDSVTRQVRVRDLPIIDLGEDTLIPYRGSITIDAGNLGSEYLWSTGDDLKFITLNELRKDTMVWVQVNDGCINYDTIYVMVGEPQSSRLFIPTAFSPNGDALNDEFKVIQKNVAKFRMMVYNRYGALMFETEDVNQGWDGNYKGSTCPPGTYAWKIVYDELDIEENASEKVEMGSVTLVR